MVFASAISGMLRRFTPAQNASPKSGIQRVVYHSPDAPAEVERWYAAQDAAQMREGVLSGDFSNTVRQSWLVEPDAERGGSLISAQTTCP
jgi:hypothetical protein